MGSMGGDAPPDMPAVQKTPQEIELERIGAAQRKDYKQRFRPIEGRLMHEVDKMGQPLERQRMAGMAGSTVQQSFGAGTPGFGGGGFTRGIVEGGVNRARTLGQGINKADLDTESRYRKGAENIISMGRDIQNQGIQGLSRGASLAQTKAFSDQQAASTRLQGDWEAAQTRGAGWANVLGTGVGFGMQRAGQAGWFGDQYASNPQYRHINRNRWSY